MLEKRENDKLERELQRDRKELEVQLRHEVVAGKEMETEVAIRTNIATTKSEQLVCRREDRLERLRDYGPPTRGEGSSEPQLRMRTIQRCRRKWRSSTGKWSGCESDERRCPE
jgi:hypothetical protein